jgi:hypothetical protein
VAGALLAGVIADAGGILAAICAVAAPDGGFRARGRAAHVGDQATAEPTLTKHVTMGPDVS